jgi:hypothetical protein
MTSACPIKEVADCIKDIPTRVYTFGRQETAHEVKYKG